jgi:glucan phosphoethanolaminetransferase (alkaline phosphatase superfamily)
VFWGIGEVLSLGLVVLAFLPIRLPLAWLGASLNLAFALLMTAYVFGLDRYTNNGTSRWTNRGSSAHTAYFVVMAVAGLSIAVFVALAVRRRRDWRIRSALAASGATNLIMGYVLVLVFDNN